MLHMLADVLMLATRMEPPRRPPEAPHRPHPQHEENRRRAWGLIGGLRL